MAKTVAAQLWVGTMTQPIVAQLVRGPDSSGAGVRPQFCDTLINPTDESTQMWRLNILMLERTYLVQ